MDRKSIVILIGCALLFVLWSYVTPRLYPPKPLPKTNVTSLASNALSSGTNASVSTSATNATGSPPSPSAPEELLVLSNDYVRCTFTSHGGGLKQVELLRYRETVSCNRRLTNAATRVATLNAQAQQPALALLGGEALTGDGVFKITQFAPAARSNIFGIGLVGIRAEKTLANGLHLIKEFELGTNYLLSARARLENRSGQPLPLPAQQWVAGTATPLNPQDDETLVGLHYYDGKTDHETGASYFQNKTFGCGCFQGTPRLRFQDSGHSVVWVTAHNQFFFLALMPKVPATELSATRFTLPPPSQEEIVSDSRTLTNQFAIQVEVGYPATSIAAGQTLEQEFLIYAGPKEYRTLERIAAVLNNELDRVMGYNGFFGFFSRILLVSMNWLHALGLSYAVAIIAITVIIKLLFWPLTAVSTRTSKRMQALQPQMKAIQEKYKDDPVKMNKKLMEFMKEHKVSPMAGCWPVLLQFPVLIGFFKMVQTAIELRGAQFLWACDLSKSDTIWVIPFLQLNVNPLPLMMGATMLWQARLMPPSPGMDPLQQKIMKYFPMIFLVILYNYSAGLTLYWTVQNLLSIAQMKLTRMTDEKKPAPAPSPPRPAPPPARKKKK